ncbi:lytic transglycosylase [Pelagovum pacificum]|uniref:Lytic transglycosylase n=1 Tax=Pelagovum pacificum TaxID=2588711 RepID=A0A5C5GHP5_9RHOB|nr:lytic transglycosylase [Pelagovum pacificum]QQA43103.1 lytic transglycosylase [Pelagovum pacificum]TNY33754.1 lytic transglycosylase [Pelagovum pacificum]
MSRLILALVILVALGSCGGRNASQPSNLENACAILAERPHYSRAFRAAEREWGVKPHVLMAMIYQESKFISNNRPPHTYALGVIPMGRQSSAFGYSQALDGTWDEYVEALGRRGARRDDIRDAVDFMGWYMTLSRDNLGIPLDDVRNQYLAYHEGRTGYSRQSYLQKSWLMRVSGEISTRAQLYEAQLSTCPRRL